MPLEVPTLDDRSFLELVREAKARIPVHNPEWTNFNDSDPGMTLLQLFAFMTENLLYRANQVPEKNRLKFLTLLGIPLRPAAAAQGFVVIRNERGPLKPVVVDAELEVRAGAVRFRTTRGLSVLPVEARVFSKQALVIDPADPDAQAEEDLYRLLYADLLKTSAPAFYLTAPLPAPGGDGALPVVDLVNDTVDRSLWIALLARPNESVETARAAIGGQTLTLGVLPFLDEEGLRVPAGSTSAEQSRSTVEWRIAAVRNNSVSYDPVATTATGAILNEPSLVEITLPKPITAWKQFEPGEEGTGDLPPSLADTDLGDRVIAWLRLRVPQDETGSARLSWLDINATMVTQRILVAGEIVGTGTGEPDQQLKLANTPVIPDTVHLRVSGEEWGQTDDLLAADPEVPVGDVRRPVYQSELVIADRRKVYALDPESGEVTFGDGAHGMRPPASALITADYAFGGGSAGNVGAGAINRSPQLSGGFKVENPIATWGGDDAEDVPTAERYIPRTVQHRDRLVSVQDFIDITERTPGIDLGRVEVLPLYDADAGRNDIPGVVTVMVIPQYDPRSPDAPTPDRFFLESVCRHLQPRRLITTELFMRGPAYVDVAVSVGVEVVGGRAIAPVLEAAKQELRTFLSPLTGGRDGLGWPLDTSIVDRELEAVVARVDGVRFVKKVILGTMTDGLFTGMATVPLANLQLPRLVGVEAALEDAVPIAPTPSETGAATPIPVVPKGC